MVYEFIYSLFMKAYETNNRQEINTKLKKKKKQKY